MSGGRRGELVRGETRSALTWRWRPVICWGRLANTVERGLKSFCVKAWKTKCFLRMAQVMPKVPSDTCSPFLSQHRVIAFMFTALGGHCCAQKGGRGGGAAGSGYLETPCGIDILSLCLHLLILSAAWGPAFRIWVYKGSCRNANCPPPAPEAFAVAGGTCLFCTNCCALLLGSLFW